MHICMLYAYKCMWFHLFIYVCVLGTMYTYIEFYHFAKKSDSKQAVARGIKPHPDHYNRLKYELEVLLYNCD